MPQMAPIWWFSLMIMFIFTLLMFMSTLYFTKKVNISMKYTLKKNNMDWLW